VDARPPQVSRVFRGFKIPHPAASPIMCYAVCQAVELQKYVANEPIGCVVRNAGALVGSGASSSLYCPEILGLYNIPKEP
jgi:hypothetical protein